jgi:hypothetical protein
MLFEKKKKQQFELLVSKEGRWLSEGMWEEEKAAIGAARAALGKRGIEAVRVTRHTTMPSGFTTSADVFTETGTNDDGPITLQGHADDAPVCESAVEVYGFPSRRIIARLFKQYLKKHQITATELMHGWTYLRKLDSDTNLIASAIHKVAVAQAKTSGQTAKERILTVQKFVELGLRAAQNFPAEKRDHPEFKPEALDDFAAKLQAKVPADSVSYFMACHLTQWLLGGALSAKLEVTLGLFDKTSSADLHGVFDAVCADVLTFGDTVKELFGYQPNRAAFIGTLADIVAQRPIQFPKGLNPLLIQIAANIAADRMPQCRDVLFEWMYRELKSDQPLDKREPEAGQRLLDDLAKKLKDNSGFYIGGKPTEEAIAAAKLKIRQDQLRRMGMHDAADALAQQWHMMQQAKAAG